MFTRGCGVDSRRAPMIAPSLAVVPCMYEALRRCPCVQPCVVSFSTTTLDTVTGISSHDSCSATRNLQTLHTTNNATQTPRTRHPRRRPPQRKYQRAHHHLRILSAHEADLVTAQQARDQSRRHVPLLARQSRLLLYSVREDQSPECVRRAGYRAGRVAELRGPHTAEGQADGCIHGLFGRGRGGAVCVLRARGELCESPHCESSPRMEMARRIRKGSACGVEIPTRGAKGK